MRVACADDDGTKISLREVLKAGNTTRAQIELKAQGLFRPGLPPGGASADARMPKPLSLEVQTRLVFHERLVRSVRVDSAGAARRMRRGKSQKKGLRESLG